MTVRELINRLEDVEDKDVEVVFYANEDGSDGIITDVELDEFDSSNYEDESELEDGTVIIIPTEWL